MKKLSLLAVSCLVAFIVVESVLNVFFPDKAGGLVNITFSKNFVQKDNALGFTGIPGAEGVCYNCETKINYKLNSSGFRDVERNFEKSGSKFRVLILGDSFAWGVGVERENMFTVLLEKENIEIINISVPGWATNQEYLYLETVGLRYNPDLVIVMYFVENDAVGNGIYEEKGYEGCIPELSGKREYNAMSIKYLQDHSRIYRFWKRKRRDFKIKWGLDTILTEYKYDSVEWKSTAEWLGRFKDLSMKNNFGLLFVLIPGRSQFFLKENTTKPQEMLIKYLKNINTDYLDLYPVFDKYRRKDQKHWGYFKYDGHWNEMGHEIAVAEIYKKIKDYL